MSTVKVTDLPYITSLQSNTSNTVLVGVDVPGDYTGQLTLTTLARGLYSNNFLYVGNNDILLANAVGQFTGNASPYLQVSLHNNDATGSGDFVVTGDVGTDTTHYVDLGIQGSSLTQGVLKALDSYIISVGDTATTPGGNLIIGTDTPSRDITITLGGHESNNVAAQFLYGQGFKLTQKPLIFADGTTQNTAVLYSGVDSRITANAASANAVINARITSNIATVLANTNGVTTAGAINVPGNILATGNLIVANTTYDYANVALVKIAGSTSGLYTPPANPGYMLSVTGVDGVSSRIINTAHGTGAYSLFAARSSRGTATSPTAVANNDVIARYSASGYNGTAFTPTGQGRIDIVADEDFTVANTGTRIEFYNTIPKTNTVAKIATFNANNVTFTGSVQPQKGFIYTPRVLPGAQTAITVDYSSDSIIKANLSADLVVSHSNFTTGKVVEMWLLNTSGLTRTITHGVSAQNSTLNSTTFTMPSTSSAYLKFFSIDGDLANTFVSIQHA